MATVNVLSITHRDAHISVDNLPHPRSEYQKFVIRIKQNDVQIFRDTIKFDDDYDNFFYSLMNPDYLGNNMFSPDCTYVAYVDCWYDGDYETLSYEFTTESITEPSCGNISPSVYAAVRDQGDYETCVADSLACAMDIFKLNETDVKYENFSTAYIYGSDESNSEGMLFEEAVDLCIDYGSPRWEIHSGTFPDSMWKDDAVTLFQNANDIVIENATKQCFKKKWVNIDFYDCDSVADAISETGYFMFNFRVPNNFYGIDEGGEVDSDGIIPQPRGGYSRINHSMALIGLTTINGKRYWEAQNSWGEDWGNGGRCFIPYDWGRGVQSPIEDGDNYGATSWTCECYAVYPGAGYTNDNPSETEISECVLDENEDRLVNMSWDNAGTDVEYIILARKKGTERWWVKPIDDNITTTDLSAKVEVNSYGTYEFMVIVIKNGYCSRQSDIITVVVTSEEDLIPTNFTVNKTYRKLSFSWEGCETATGFNVLLTRNWDGAQYEQTNITKKNCSFDDLDFGVEYTVAIQVYNDSFESDYIIMDSSVLTCPSPPIVSRRIDGNCVMVDYGVQDITNISAFNFKLLDDAEVILEDVTISVENNEQNPSGTYQFNIEYDKRYYIDVRTILYENNDQTMPLYGLTENNHDYVSLSIYIDSTRPENWYWWSDDILYGNDLTVGDDKEVHPVLADEWNEFTIRINDFRQWYEMEDFEFTQACSSYEDEDGYCVHDFTPSIYNEAAEAIRDMGTYSSDELPDISDDTYLSASLFLLLQDKLNNLY